MSEGFLGGSGWLNPRVHQGNDVVQVSVQRGLWRGMLYVPQGEVDVAGDGFTLYGSIIANTIKLTRQGIRVLHNAY